MDQPNRLSSLSQSVRTEEAGWLAVRRVVVVLCNGGKEVAIYRGENGEEAFGQRWCPRRGFLFSPSTKFLEKIH